MSVDIVYNAALLFTMAFFYDAIVLRREFGDTRLEQVVVGAGLAVISVSVMTAAFEVQDGVILDTRSVLLSTSAVFFGPIPAIIGAAAAAGYRIHQGGAGAPTGVAVILATTACGIAWRARVRDRLDRIGWWELIAFGVVTHLVMLLMFFVVGFEGSGEVAREIAPTVLLVYPLAVALLGISLGDRIRRVRLSEELTEREERFRSLFEQPSVAMFLVDPSDGAFIDVNDAAARLYGWSRAELRSMRIADVDIAEPEDIDRAVTDAQLGDRLIFVRPHRIASGEVREMEVLTGPIRIEGRDLLHSIVRDVTERVRTERALQEADEQLRVLLDEAETSRRILAESLAELQKLTRAVDQSPASVVITDLDGSILYVNRKFTEITGYAFEEVHGQNPRLLKSGLTPATTYDELWANVSNGHEWRGELHNRAKDGRLFWERVVISPIVDGEGSVTSYVAVKEDITTERALEEQLHQAMKMEAVGRLAGGVAHDFNNKLQVILGYADLVRDALPAGSAEQHALDQIREAASQSAALTRQLLAFARRQPVQPEVIDLATTVEGMLTMLRRLIGDDVELVWQTAADLWPVRIDPAQIDQVLANVTINARDAMPHGGRLEIVAHNVVLEELSVDEAATAKPGDFVLLEITDTGEGMDAELLGSVFEPFFTTKEQGRGTGLGLAIVYGAVTQSHGVIRVASTPGVGTTFRIYLPRSTDRPDAASGSEDGRGNGDETVLVVEDEPGVLHLAAGILRRHGYTVLTAPDGPTAVALVDRRVASGDGHIDLLLTDLAMPEMNGHELYHALLDRIPDLPVVYMSGYTIEVIGRVDETDTDESHHIELLSKPFTADELTGHVRSVLDSVS
jgi:two-component system, cell cycle sensor histidine kinase and response regulator CckA